MKPVASLLLAALSAWTMLPALAQTSSMKPGLWELKQKPQFDAQRQAQMEEAQKQMAALPPEQRKMMEQMMAKSGVSVGMADGVVTLKVCVSPEQAARKVPQLTDRGNCKQDVSQNGSVTKVHFTCTDPTTEGDSEISFKGGDSYTANTRVTTLRNGKSETMTMSGEGRWLGSDCGSIKPVQPLPGK
jgi:hypothetical protein